MPEKSLMSEDKLDIALTEVQLRNYTSFLEQATIQLMHRTSYKDSPLGSIWGIPANLQFVAYKTEVIDKQPYVWAAHSMSIWRDEQLSPEFMAEQVAGLNTHGCRYSFMHLMREIQNGNFMLLNPTFLKGLFQYTDETYAEQLCTHPDSDAEENIENSNRRAVDERAYEWSFGDW